MSIRWCAVRIASNVRTTSPPSATLQDHTSARPPAAPIASAVRLAAASSRSRTAMCACCRANSVAMAAPMPDPAPVTTAILCVSSNTRPKYYTLPVKSTGFGPVHVYGHVTMRRRHWIVRTESGPDRHHLRARCGPRQRSGPTITEEMLHEEIPYGRFLVPQPPRIRERRGHRRRQCVMKLPDDQKRPIKIADLVRE